MPVIPHSLVQELRARVRTTPSFFILSCLLSSGSLHLQGCDLFPGIEVFGPATSV